MPGHGFKSGLLLLLWLLLGLAAVLLVGYLGMQLPGESQSVQILVLLVGLALVHAVLAIILDAVFSGISVTPPWRQRLSFGISLGMPVLVSILIWLRRLPVDGDLTFWCFLAWMIMAAIGAFAGCLSLTYRRYGLWEDNSPPPETVEQLVYQMHQELLVAPVSSPWSKRVFDILVSGAGMLFSSPIWLASMCLVWLEDPGPLLFVKNSVGRGGRNFRQLKMRTMVIGAEETTGPVMAQERDARALVSGRFLRKTHLDEIPQLINILKGEMSVVGPRPQRTVLVAGYLLEMPEYSQRHSVLPGLAGLAQVAGSYYLTPRQKLRLDRLYIQHMNLGYDLKLLFAAFLIAFWFRWKKDWDGRLPRWLLH